MHRIACICVIGALAAAPADAQRRKAGDPDAWQVDPYTKNDDAALRRAGYVSYGPLTWADQHDSARIREELGRIPLRFVETPHFKIGSSLTGWAVPRDKDVQRRLALELARLRERLPLAPAAARSVDPWLRLHLFAQRLEELYAEVQALCGVTDESFVAPRPDGKHMGRGPYLGVRGKFLVLLFEKSSSCGRYLSTFTRAGHDQPSRWFFADSDSFLFATAQEFGDGAFRNDTALHAHVVFNVTHNLIDAFKGYSYLVPIWWKEGLAHSLRRAVSVEWNNFSLVAEPSERDYLVHDWDVKVKARLGHGLVRPLTELLDNFDCVGITLVDHMAIWSRIEFLRSLGDEKFALFLDRMKGCVDAQGVPIPREALLERQTKAIDEAWGFDAEELDTAWAAWVKKTYPAK